MSGAELMSCAAPMSGAEPKLPSARLTFRRYGGYAFNLFVERAAFQPTETEIRRAVAALDPPLTGTWKIGFWGDRDGFVTLDFTGGPTERATGSGCVGYEVLPDHPSGLSGEHGVVLDAIQEACL